MKNNDKKMLREISNDILTPKKHDFKVENDLYERIDVEIKGAELKDGLLKVSLNKILPEGKQPKSIEVK